MPLLHHSPAEEQQHEELLFGRLAGDVSSEERERVMEDRERRWEHVGRRLAAFLASVPPAEQLRMLQALQGRRAAGAAA